MSYRSGGGGKIGSTGTVCFSRWYTIFQQLKAVVSWKLRGVYRRVAGDGCCWFTTSCSGSPILPAASCQDRTAFPFQVPWFFQNVAQGKHLRLHSRAIDLVLRCLLRHGSLHFQSKSLIPVSPCGSPAPPIFTQDAGQESLREPTCEDCGKQIIVEDVKFPLRPANLFSTIWNQIGWRWIRSSFGAASAEIWETQLGTFWFQPYR